jgi:hypothetical protein
MFRTDTMFFRIFLICGWLAPGMQKHGCGGMTDHKYSLTKAKSHMITVE